MTGTLALVAGLALKMNPPKKINWWYGYRTKRSMKGQEQWDFAQRFGAENMMKYSSILFSTVLLGFIIEEQKIGLSIGVVVISTLLWAFLSIYKTEIKLKSKFE